MIRWTFRPPLADLAAKVALATTEAVRAGGEVLLHAAQADTPVDTGALRDSAKLAVEGPRAAVSFGFDDQAGRDGRSTSDYVIYVHERLDTHHPQGRAKFLEIPMHEQRMAIADAVASVLRKALR